jgi:hypothetical protein
VGAWQSAHFDGVRISMVGHVTNLSKLLLLKGSLSSTKAALHLQRGQVSLRTTRFPSFFYKADFLLTLGVAFLRLIREARGVEGADFLRLVSNLDRAAFRALIASSKTFILALRSFLEMLFFKSLISIA